MLNNPSTNNAALLIARILMCILFIWAGWGKIQFFDAQLGRFAGIGIPLPAIVLPLTILLEIGGGILILIGYQTRIVALALAIFSVLAALLAHLNFGDLNQTIHFLKNLVIAGGFLSLMVAGAGAYSLDGRKA